MCCYEVRAVTLCCATGGESVWGEPFRDEFKSNLTHSGEQCVISLVDAWQWKNLSGVKQRKVSTAFLL